MALLRCLLLSVASIQIISAQFSRECMVNHDCRSLPACPKLLAILRRQTRQDIQTVQRALCGFEGRIPKVCCPSPTPPPPTSDFFPTDCGHSTLTVKVTNGEQARLGDFPWIASLGYLRNNVDNPSLEFLCAGSIVNQRYVLTAAHCFDPNDIGSRHLSVVRLGEWNLKTNPDCEFSRLGSFCAPPHITAMPEDIVVHKDYGVRARTSDDIALIRLDRTLEFTASVQPLCMPPASLNVFERVGEQPVIAMGWGFTENRSEIVDIVRKVQLPLQPHDRCEAVHPGRYLDKQLCVGGTDGKDTCSGDSGAPVIVSQPTGPPYVQIGIVSYGPSPCGIPNFPAVYTSVSSYRQWIAENMLPW